MLFVTGWEQKYVFGMSFDSAVFTFARVLEIVLETGTLLSLEHHLVVLIWNDLVTADPAAAGVVILGEFNRCKNSCS